MKRYAMLNPEGRPLAFYHDDVHGPRELTQLEAADESDAEPQLRRVPNPHTLIPAGAVEISDEQWQALCSQPHTKALVDGELVDVEPPPRPPLTRAQILRRRDAALAHCLWTAFPEAPLTGEQRQAWSQYRAALFALTTVDPAKFVMPVPPA
ncbi:MAG TPA: phage tail assembly chaperone [Nevskia sp.]|nr:phage tail assembly chaperone [Nevskia sp.]